MLATTLLAVLALSIPSSAKPCPPLGRTLPAPTAPSTNSAVKQAGEALAKQLQDALQPLLKQSAVSVAVKSLHEDKPLFNWHFTPTNMSGIGTTKVDENTIYRVGSFSKVVAALVALQSDNIDMQASVLKYLPDLKKSVSLDAHHFDWEDVTVESLASHLSGLPTSIATDLAVFAQIPWTDLGLPPVADGTGPTCSGFGGTPKCTTKDILDTINRNAAIFKPFTSPAYSSTAYGVLGMVLEAATGKRFADLAREAVFDVAGMKASSFEGFIPSLEKLVFVPQQEPTWNGTLGVFEAAGGMFSSTSDMLAFTDAIMSNRLLSPATTRAWMKPKTHTASLSFSVGAPWEILRSTRLAKDGRVIDVYTKTGDLGLYHAHAGIVPDYDISVSVLTGGQEVAQDPHTATEIFSSTVKALIPAIDEAARSEASSDRGHVATYVDKDSKSKLVLAIDNGPGTSIREFTVRGFDVLSHISLYSLDGIQQASNSTAKAFVDGRLYPSDMSTSKTVKRREHSKHLETRDGTSGTRHVFRAVFETATHAQRHALEDKLFYEDGACESWFNLDQRLYDFNSLGEFQFIKDDAGAVKAVENEAFGVTMVKV